MKNFISRWLDKRLEGIAERKLSEIDIDQLICQKAEELTKYELNRIISDDYDNIILFKRDDRQNIDLPKMIDESLKKKFEQLISKDQIEKIVISFIEKESKISLDQFIYEKLNEDLKFYVQNREFIQGLIEEINKYQLDNN